MWDARDSQYRNKHARTKLWNEISENEFDSKFRGVELLAKWFNVRIQFRSYAGKKPKSGQSASPPINWKFFAAMLFVGHAECEQTALTESNLVSAYSIKCSNCFHLIVKFSLCCRILKAAAVLLAILLYLAVHRRQVFPENDELLHQIRHLKHPQQRRKYHC